MNQKNIWLQVFTFLDQRELSNCELVSSDWHHYINSDSVQMREIFGKCYCKTQLQFKWFANKLTNIQLHSLEFFLFDECIIVENDLVNMISQQPLERLIIRVLGENILHKLLVHVNLTYFETHHVLKNRELAILSQMPNLRELHIRVQKQDEEQLTFGNFRNLTSVSLQTKNLNYQDVSLMLRSCDTLRELELEAEDCSSEEMLELLMQVKLEKLYLYYFEDYNDKILYRISEFNKLNRLQIRKARDISEGAMYELVRNKQFIELNLDQCEQVTDKVLYVLAMSSLQLKIINLSWNFNISNEIVALLLENCKHLEEVYLVGCKQLTNKCIPNAAFQYLRVLDFEQCNDMNDDQLKLFKQQHKYVRIINFYGYEIE